MPLYKLPSADFRRAKREKPFQNCGIITCLTRACVGHIEADIAIPAQVAFDPHAAYLTGAVIC